MREKRFSLALAVVAFLVSSAAFGQNVRSWVSSDGLDTNDCTRQAPCRTFGRAIVTANANGEVAVLDSAGYGPFEITKAIQIIAPEGVHAAIAPTSGIAINIQPAANDAVVLKNLFLNSQGANTGILVQGSVKLVLQDVAISGFFYGLSSALGHGSLVTMKHCVARKNGTGVLLVSGNTDGDVFGTLEDVLITDSGVGLLITAEGEASSMRVVARNVTSVSNDTGFQASATGPGSLAIADLESCVSASNSSYGIYATEALGTTTRIRVSNSVVTANFSAFVTGGDGSSQILSRGNNTVEDNDFFETFTGAYSAK